MTEMAGSFGPGGRGLEDQIALLAQRAQVDGDDFRVKIGRNDSPAGRVESLCTFDAVTIEMIANADTWIPPLLGGTGTSGAYYLYVTHAKDRSQGRTSAMLRLPSLAGDPIPAARVEWARIDQPGWTGPKALVYPDPKAGAGTGASGGHFAGSQSGTGSPPLYYNRAPPPAVPSTDPNYALVQLQREREQIAEERRRAEIEAIKRENAEAQRRHDAHLSELRDLVKTVAQGAAQRPTAVDPTETIVKVASAFIPLLTPILDARRAEAAREAEREARRVEREELRRSEDAKERAALMERLANQGAEQSKAQAALAEAHATSMRTMIQTVTSLMELGIGQKQPEDEGWGSIAKAFFSAMGEGMAARMSQPALPAAAPRPAAPPPAAAPPPPPAPAPSANGSFAGAPASDAGNEVSIVESLVARIAARDPDTAGLTDAIIHAIQNDAEMQAALAEYDGNVVALFQAMLGDSWANDPQNLAYAQALLALLGEKGKAAGMVA